MKPRVVLFVFLLFAIQVVVAPPGIISYPPTALPGEILNLYGSFPKESRAYLGSTILTDEIKLRTVLSQDDFLAVLIPSDLPLDVFSLRIEDSSGVSSDKVLVNAPVDVTTDTLGEIVAGSTIRVYGRNLFFGVDSVPSLALMDDSYVGDKKKQKSILMRWTTKSGNLTVSFDLNLNESDQHVLVATVPQDAITVETDYQLVILNGLTSCPAVTMDNPLTGRLSADVFNVGIGWVSDVRISTRIELAPSGADDTTAIRAAFKNASSLGGGLVVLSAGKFQIRDCAGLEMLPNVVIQGAGVELTELQVGLCPSPSASSLWASQRLVRFGLLDLTISDQLASASTNLPSIEAQSASDFFMHRVRIKAPQLSFSRLSRAVLSNSELIQTPGSNGSLEFACAANFLMRNTTITLAGGFLLLDHTSNFILSDSIITKDGSVASSSTKLLSLSHSKGVIMYKNSLTTNGFDFASASQEFLQNYYGDVEGAVVAQNADSFIEADWGTVQRASGSDLVDRTYYWSPFVTTLYAAVVSGTGLGQIREVISNTETTVVTREPWAVVPNGGESRYALTPLTAANWLVKKNVISNHVRSIVLSGGAMWELLFVDNSFVDSGGLFIQPHQLQRDPSAPRVVITEADGICESASNSSANSQQRLFGFAYGVDILSNTVTTSRSEITAEISFSPRQVDLQVVHGVSFLGVRVRGNNISATYSGASDSSGEESGREGQWIQKTYFTVSSSSAIGFVNSACIKLSGSLRPDVTQNIPLLFGSVYQNNAIANAPTAILIGPSAAFTTITCMQTQSVKLPAQLQSTSLCPSFGLQATNTATKFDGLCVTSQAEWRIARPDAAKKSGKKLSLIVSILVIAGVAVGIAILVGLCFGLHEWREGSADERRAKRRARKQLKREEVQYATSFSSLLTQHVFHRHSSELQHSTGSSPRTSFSESSIPTTNSTRGSKEVDRESRDKSHV